MRRVGTITSALGFIFLGIWMMVNTNNPELGKTIFKWWPLLIILLGVEILYTMSEKQGLEKIKISGFIIPVILIFLVVNAFSSLSYALKKDFNFSWGNVENILNHSDFTDKLTRNSKSIDSNLTLEPFGNTFNFEATNGDIKIEKAKDNKITLETKIYVDKSHSIDQYKINATKDTNGYTIKFLDDYIHSIKAVLYVPENYEVSLNGTNMQIKSNDDIKLTDLKVKINNGNVNLDGDIPNCSIAIDNGKLDFQNKLCKNIDIKVLNGAVSLNTTDKNLSFNTDINWGPCEINGQKRVNSGMSNTIGTGEGKIGIKVNNGAIKVDSEE